MKTFCLPLAFTLTGMLVLVSIVWVMAQPSTNMSLEETLKAYQWQKRVVLLCANSAQQPDLVRQKALLSKNKAGLKERDIEEIDLRFDQLKEQDKAFLRDKLAVPAQPFTVILIGKDGEVKLKQTTPLSMETLFSTVDAMPMRRREMNNQ